VYYVRVALENRFVRIQGLQENKKALWENPRTLSENQGVPQVRRFQKIGGSKKSEDPPGILINREILRKFGDGKARGFYKIREFQKIRRFQRIQAFF
jgi:hypothetical protein